MKKAYVTYHFEEMARPFRLFKDMMLLKSHYKHRLLADKFLIRQNADGLLTSASNSIGLVTNLYDAATGWLDASRGEHAKHSNRVSVWSCWQCSRTTLLVVYFDRNSSALKLEKVSAMNLSQTHRSFRRMTCRNNMRDCVGVVDLVKNEATIIDLDRFRWNDKVSPVATVVVRYDGALHVDCE